MTTQHNWKPDHVLHENMLLDCGDIERSGGTANYRMDGKFANTTTLAAALRP